MTASPDRAGLLREAAQAFLDWYDSPRRSYQRDGTEQRVVADLRTALAAIGDSGGPLNVERLAKKPHGNHAAELPIGAIVAALRKHERLVGLWVQYPGDGHGFKEVRVSIQTRLYGTAVAHDGRGPTVHAAADNLAARLSSKEADHD